jgi:pyruvate kinase
MAFIQPSSIVTYIFHFKNKYRKMKNSFNRTKIVATLGPASNTRSKIKSLINSGANVFRLNFSHGSQEENLKRIHMIRSLNESIEIPVAILADLQGPKIRIGTVENGAVNLKVGQKITITTNDIVGNSEKISTTYTLLPKDVEKGDIILIDDGNIGVSVLSKEKKVISGQVLYGGVLKSKKGINLPNTRVSIPSLTEKDKRDLEFCLENDVDWIALSFVRRAEDIVNLREIIKESGKEVKIVAKIEKPEAVENINEILEVSDAIMVARGDLGVEIPMEQVPMVQKMLVKKCNKVGKPVIVATQMLESMAFNPRPTRAESSDVANAIMDGADAIMLSVETAAGMYPSITVRSMSKIIASVENGVDFIYNKNFEGDEDSELNIFDRVLASACKLANETGAKVITGITGSGYTAFNIARQRPVAQIYIFTGNKKLMTQLALLWGVKVIFYEKFESTDDAVYDIQRILVERKILKFGDIYVTSSAIPVASGKRNNSVRINIVE